MAGYYGSYGYTDIISESFGDQTLQMAIMFHYSIMLVFGYYLALAMYDMCKIVKGLFQSPSDSLKYGPASSSKIKN